MKLSRFKKNFKLILLIVFISPVIVIGFLLTSKSNYFGMNKLTKLTYTKNAEINLSPSVLPTTSASGKTSRLRIISTSAPTSIPSNTPTPTPNICPMGKTERPMPDPSVRVESVSPISGRIGDIIVIKGSGFGKSSFYFPDPTKFMGSVSFYGKLCGYNSGGAPPAMNGEWDYSWWTENELKVKVPAVSSDFFEIEVMSSDGKRSNRVEFEVLR